MTTPTANSGALDERYQSVLDDVAGLIDAAQRTAARSMNAVMTAAYWLIGTHIVEFKQGGEERAEYRSALIERLAADWTKRSCRGFSLHNIWQMRLFYQTYPPERILQTVSGELPESPQQAISQTPSGELHSSASTIISADGVCRISNAPFKLKLVDCESDGRRPYQWKQSGGRGSCLSETGGS